MTPDDGMPPPDGRRGARLSRRAFLAGLPPLLLGGCTVAPAERFWGLFTWAERLDRALMRPFKLARVKTYPREAASGTFPIRSLDLDPDYAQRLAGWKLQVGGLVERPAAWDLPALRQAFPYVAETTRHDCVEGWSAIAEWGGVRLPDLLAHVRPRPEARFVVFHAADFDARAGLPFYGSLALDEAAHPQILLAYAMNGAPLSVDHGAPLRLKVPNQLGYKSTKFVWRIDLVASLAGLGRGQGGYWEDAGYEHWAGI